MKRARATAGLATTAIAVSVKAVAMGNIRRATVLQAVPRGETVVPARTLQSRAAVPPTGSARAVQEANTLLAVTGVDASLGPRARQAIMSQRTHPIRAIGAAGQFLERRGSMGLQSTFAF